MKLLELPLLPKNLKVELVKTAVQQEALKNHNSYLKNKAKTIAAKILLQALQLLPK